MFFDIEIKNRIENMETIIKKGKPLGECMDNQTSITPYLTYRTTPEELNRHFERLEKDISKMQDVFKEHFFC